MKLYRVVEFTDVAEEPTTSIFSSKAQAAMYILLDWLIFSPEN
jgi:hypothetical protein